MAAAQPEADLVWAEFFSFDLCSGRVVPYDSAEITEEHCVTRFSLFSRMVQKCLSEVSTKSNVVKKQARTGTNNPYF